MRNDKEETIKKVNLINGISYFFAVWILPVVVIGGIQLLILTMHLAKLPGQVHGMLAKLMLVRI